MNDKIQTLNAQLRDGAGKGVNHRVRASGKLPGVLYGVGTESRGVVIDPKELTELLSNPYGFNTVFNVQLEGEEPYLCMIKERQFDSVRRVLTHVDLFSVTPDRIVTVEVPVVTKGRSAGERAGGRLMIAARSVRLSCKIEDIPMEVPHDITKLQISDAVYIDDMTPPSGCEFVYRNRFPVLRIARRRGTKTTEEGAEEAAAE